MSECDYSISVLFNELFIVEGGIGHQLLDVPFVELVAGLIVKSWLLKAPNSLAGHWSNSMLPKLDLQISKIISQ